MLAVVKIAGQQFTVKAGDSLYVPHISGKTGDSVEFSDVLMTHDGNNFASGTGVKAVVKAEIVNRPEDYRYSSAIDYAGGKGLLKVVVV